MQVERCTDRDHPCQGDKCDKPVEFLITWPDQKTLYLCGECRKQYSEESPSPEPVKKGKKAKQQEQEEETE